MKSVFIVTGTSRGLGKALVNELINQGNEVICIQRKAESESQSMSNIIEFDLSKIDDLAILVDLIFKKIKIKMISSIFLVNNAAVLDPIKPLFKFNQSEIKYNIEVNLISIIQLTSLVLNRINNVNINKVVVNISSGAASKPIDGWTLYCVSKAAIEMFTKCVALEQERSTYPAKIISFVPGVIDTKMQENIRNTSVQDFPSVAYFTSLKDNNYLLSPETVSKRLIDLLMGKPIENGKAYNVKDLIETQEKIIETK